MSTPAHYPDPPRPIYRRSGVLLSGGAILLIALLAIATPAALRFFKNWRAEVLAEAARGAWQQGQAEEATGKVRSALMLAPDSWPAQRAAAEILTATRDGGALGMWEKVLASPQAGLPEHQSAVECAVGFAQPELAAEWLKPLLESAPGNPKTLLLSAKIALLNHQRPEALALAEKAVAADPANARAQLFLGSVQLMDMSTSPTGVATLFTLSSQNDAEGLTALETLARVSLTPDQLAEVTLRLRAHPLSGPAQKLLALALELQAHPEQRAALLDAAGAAYQKGDPKAFRDFCSWLNGTGESARVITLLPLRQAKTRKDFFLVWLDAQAALQHWEEIRTVLGTKPLPLEDMYVELYLTRCADELKDETGAALHWRLAQLASQADPQQALDLASYAEMQGRADRATAIYQELAANPRLARAACEGLLRLAQKQNTEAVLAVLEQMHERWPLDTAVENDRVYYNLLLKRRLPDMLKAAEELVKKEPASLPHQTNLALAYLRLRSVERAAQVYQGLEVNWDQAPASALVIYAAVLQAQNRDELAASITRKLRPEALREEERLLLYGVH